MEQNDKGKDMAIKDAQVWDKLLEEREILLQCSIIVDLQLTFILMFLRSLIMKKR